MSGKDTSLSSNRLRRWVWLAIGALVVAAVIGWLWTWPESDARTDLADVGSADVADTPVQSSEFAAKDIGSAAIAPLDSRLDQVALPGGRRHWMDEPLLVDETILTADAVKSLLPLAKVGNAGAMRELAFRLNSCRNAVEGDEVSVRRSALRKFYLRNGHEPRSDVELSVIAAVINAETAMLDRCRGVDPSLMATRIDWLERAARAGDIWASLYYPANALNDMRDTDDILIHLDEVVRRRQLARDFLQKALDRGVCDALIMLSTAYSGQRGPFDWLFKADPYISLVYAEAAFRAGINSGVPAQTVARVVDPTKRTAAAAQGAAIAARHCDAVK